MKKIFLSIGTMLVGISPIITTIACSKDKLENMSKIITINIKEESWKKPYEEIIKQFKKDKKDELNKKGIKDIRLLKINSDLKSISKWGFKNEKLVSDIFIYSSNELKKLLEKKALKNFTTNSAKEFLDTYASGKSYILNASDLLVNGKLYGVPQNIQTMAALHVGNENISGTSNSKNLMIDYSNLEMAAGFFNSHVSQNIDTANSLKNIIQTNEDGNIVYGDMVTIQGETIKNEWKKFIKIGFSKIVDNLSFLNSSANLSNQINENAFSSDKSISNEHLMNFFSDNKAKTTFLAGYKSISKIQKKFGDDEVNKLNSSKPKNLNQWGIKTMFGLNSRITEEEQAISEMLIPYFYKREYAKSLYENARILSPTNDNKMFFNSSTRDGGYKGISDIPATIYDFWENNDFYEKPLDKAFNIIPDIYSRTIEESKGKLSTIKRDSTTLSKINLSIELTNNFMKILDEEIKKANNSK